MYIWDQVRGAFKKTFSDAGEVYFSNPIRHPIEAAEEMNHWWEKFEHNLFEEKRRK